RTQANGLSHIRTSSIIHHPFNCRRWMVSAAWGTVTRMATIGKRNTLKVLRDSKPGLYLDGGELGEILLPNRYVPRRFSRGDQLEVFVYRDSEDRLVATTETPRACAGEVVSLRVVSIHQRMGAFLDWGLTKDLLLPFREQTRPVAVGQEVTVRVYVDP